MHKQQTGRFEFAFKLRREEMRKRATEAGISLEAMCKQAGVSIAVFHRWGNRVPLSIRLMDKLDDSMTELETKLGMNRSRPRSK